MKAESPCHRLGITTNSALHSPPAPRSTLLINRGINVPIVESYIDEENRSIWLSSLLLEGFHEKLYLPFLGKMQLMRLPKAA